MRPACAHRTEARTFAAARARTAARRRTVTRTRTAARPFTAASILAAAGTVLLGGCGGPLSTLEPAGLAAESISDLFLALAIGAALTWLAVVALGVYAVRRTPEEGPPKPATMLIIGGGAVVPTLVLAGYLVYGLAMLPDLTAPAPEGSLRIEVSGEQWWWRIQYHLPDGRTFDLANEVRIPVDEPVQFVLGSPDVIHSFWIPSIGGKMDMIPGRVTRLALQATRTGVFKGACAEYCGSSHALMTFYTVVMEQAEFDRWVSDQMSPAAVPSEAAAARGAELFLAHGCGACHTVRGTPADGVVGPDLTHVASRRSIGAGILPTREEAFFRWTAHTGEVKPGVLMPSFGMLPEEDLTAVAAYLAALR